LTDGFTHDDVPDQSGRTFLVTGANTGIGFEAAKVLAARGGRVLLGCRSEARAVSAMEAISADVAGADLDFVHLDQGDLASVRAAAEQVSRESRLDVLVNNAGIMHVPKGLTVDGFELHFGVNHLGTFALTSHLLDKLAECEGSRVVTTSSIAHYKGEIHFDDIRADKSYGGMDRYRQSKLANLLFMYELDRRLSSIGPPTISVGCHPGVAETDLPRHLGAWFRVVTPLFRPFFNTQQMGAWPTLMAATAPGMTGGDYFGPTRRGETVGTAHKVSSNPMSRDPELARRLWQLSIEMTGADPGI